VQLRLIAVVAALALAGPLLRVAPAAPADELEEARALFQRGDFGGAIPRLNYLLYPEARLSALQDLVEAHLLLGVSYYETGDRAAAAREFEETLFLDADAALDPNIFSEGAVKFFEDTKDALEDRFEREAEMRRLAEERDRYRRALENLVVIEKRPYYVNFIPFGAGQFQNGHTRKGILFFTAEAVLGGTSAGIFLWQWGKYGIGGNVPFDEQPTVFRLQTVQVITGSLALGVMAWGIIDALIYYKPTQRAAADPSLLPDDFVPPPAGPPSSSFRLSPLVSPEAGGLSLSWEF
jgi:tetratricopeptide (TPR) repeat protein